MMRRARYSVAAGLAAALLHSATGKAQVAVMNYLPVADRPIAAPVPPEPVPVGGGIFLLLLAALLGASAWRKLGHGVRNTSLSLLLAAAALGAAVPGGDILHQAWAAAFTPLDDPEGGQVDVFHGPQKFRNVSGVKLAIVDIIPHACPSTPLPIPTGSNPECEAKLELEDGESCVTEMAACRITYQQDTWWVRADYAAPLADHGAVCGEFGLYATPNHVELPWDETLLETLSSDYGFASNGNVGPPPVNSMWCWEGDGGPATDAGACETRNYGAQYRNYGAYGDDPDIRPVFTCAESPPG